MLKNLFKLGITCSVAVVALSSCENQDFTSFNTDAKRIEVNTISPAMAKVRDYVPKYAVMAHRGSTFWAPEETEAAWRWAREMGADYLESDLQCTKDGVILANHDDNLKRTTNIENVYGELVPESRKAFYMKHGLSEKEAEEQVAKDKASFRPYYSMSYMYEELLALDAGTWFNESSLEQARQSFSDIKQYVSTLEDQIRYAEGKVMKRDANGERIYTITGTWDSSNPRDCLTYTFEYEADPADTGNRPGVYIEFKESWLNPSDFEKRVYEELDRLGWNIITKPCDGVPHYVNGKVNVGNSNGKVVLQTFSLESLRRTAEYFKGKIPMCFLFWEGTAATDLKYDTPSGYASFINLGLEHKAHIIGPCIAGAPNDYPEMNAPWQAYLIRKAGMLNHPYSFDSYAQMGKYFGEYNWGNTTEFDDLLKSDISGKALSTSVYGDGAFTNRSEMTLKYFIEHGLRPAPAPQDVPDAVETLERLGYYK
ncbi:MAG TPA: glycerophosphodiester phosphodiesterase [Candidatus Barnesiella excrementigallinarum]|nr:glycerophosphodiester phosphodiesterase [Candidatus Barnesiella excrementigallinarum]